MKKVVIIVLILVLIILGVLVSLQLKPDDEKTLDELASVKPSETSDSNYTGNPVAENETLEGGEDVIGEISGGGGGGGGSGGGAGDNPPEEPVTLPDDLYTAPCGSYFTRYDVCAGYCDLGVCTQEGRSCYCKMQ